METFQVFSFGSNAHGQLGVTAQSRQRKQVSVPVLLESFQGRRMVKQIACGSSTTWQILENGECYGWGDLPELGHSATSRRIPQLKDKVVKHISSSLTSSYTSVVFENGESSYWAPNASQLKELSFEGGLAKQIICTSTHFLAILESGWVVQRDHPLPMGSVKEHQVLGPEKGIIAIAAHDLYSAALSDTGELYTWGIGPLGHRGSSNPIKPKPEKVLGALEGKKVISVACGRDHMVCVTDTGELYTWGSATRHQLGQGEVGARVSEPQRVQALAGKKIVSCSCGDYFSACISDTGVLYTFGDGSSGALGHDDFSNEPFPRVVETFRNKTVKSVICGAQHTVCIVLADINQNQSLLMTDIGRICQAEDLRGGHTLGEDECFYDVKLRCMLEPHKAPLLAHKVILAARCPSWNPRLGSRKLNMSPHDEKNHELSASQEPEEIMVEDMAYDVMLEFVRYLYTDRLNPDLEDRILVHLFAAAEQLNLPRLQTKCQALWEQGLASISSAETKLALHTSEQNEWKNRKADSTTLALRLRELCLEYLIRQFCEKPQSSSAPLSSSQSLSADPALAKRQVSILQELLQLSDRCKRLEKRGEGEVEPKHDHTAANDDDEEEELMRSSDGTDDEEEEPATDDEVPPHSLGADLEQFVGNTRFADVQFHVEDAAIPAHKAILCARCPHFRAMLTSGMLEAQSGRIVVPDISSSAFNTVLKYIYTGKAGINEDNVIELLIISNIYSILQLQEQCESYIESGIQLDNVTDLLQMAHQFQTHHLRSVAINYLVGRLKGDFSKLEGFSELSQDIQDEFKRGIPCPGESLIKAKSGGFQGKRFYFMVISRDFFKKRILTGQEKWDIQVKYEGELEPPTTAAGPLSPTVTNPPDEKEVSPSPHDETKPTLQTSGQASAPIGFGFRPSTASRARRGVKGRSHVGTAQRDKTRSTVASSIPVPSSPPATSNFIQAANEDATDEAQSLFGQTFFTPTKPTESTATTPTSSSGGPFIRAKRRGIKKAHSPEPFTDPDLSAFLEGEVQDDDSNRASVLLTSNSDGTYTASFLPESLGRYVITVTLNGVPIKNSPFPLRIEKQIYSRNCRAAFSGESANGITVAGQEVSLVIQSRDVQNRPISVGGAEPGFRVCVYLPPSKDGMILSGNPSFVFNPSRQNLSDKGLFDVHVKDNKDGTYEAQFTLRRAGDFLVDVVRQEISDKLRLPIFGSPFPIFCFPAASHGPKCEAEGDGLHSAVLGQQASFRIRTFDRYANLRDVGGDTFIVRILKRGALALVRNEEEEREKEEEKKREEESLKKANEMNSLSIDQKRQQQEQQDDEIEDAAEVRREEERQKKDKEATKRRKQQQQEWARLEEQLDKCELGRGVVVDEGNGTYTATYVIDLPVLRRQRRLERNASASAPQPSGEQTEATDGKEKEVDDEKLAKRLQQQEEEEEEVESDEDLLRGFDPQAYQIVVTLDKGGMIKDSPFNILLLRDSDIHVSNDGEGMFGVNPSSSSTLSPSAQNENRAGTLQRVAGNDGNDRFLFPSFVPDEEEAEGKDIDEQESELGTQGSAEQESEAPAFLIRKHLIRRAKPPRKGSLLLPSSSSSLDPPFSPPIFIPTSPRPSSSSATPSSPFSPSPSTPTNSFGPSSPFASPSSSPAPAAFTFPTSPVILPAPAPTPAPTGFTTEIFSTMFTAHMELMNQNSAFTFAPALPSNPTSPSFSFTQPSTSSTSSPSSSPQPFVFSSTRSASTSPSTAPTASALNSTQPSAPPPFSFGAMVTTRTTATSSTTEVLPQVLPEGDGDDEDPQQQLRGKKSRGDE